MMCKNSGIYGVLGTSWVLITMAPCKSRPVNHNVLLVRSHIYIVRDWRPRILSMFSKMPTNGRHNAPWGKTTPRGERQRPAGGIQRTFG